MRHSRGSNSFESLSIEHPYLSRAKAATVCVIVGKLMLNQVLQLQLYLTILMYSY